LDDKGVEPGDHGRAQESALSAVNRLARATLPLEVGSLTLDADGHLHSTPADRPLTFRFTACGVQFEAEIAGRTAPLRLRANLGKLPYSAESPEGRSLARDVLGASGRLRRGHILLTPEHDMMLEGELAPPSPRTPASVIATTVALVLDFQPYLDLLGEAVALRRTLRPAAEEDAAGEALCGTAASPSPSSV
jgi:hypothetical protein